MKKSFRMTGIIWIVFAFALSSCADQTTQFSKAPESNKLTDLSKEFEKKIYKIADGVYSAVGYSIANCILLVGADGIVVIDTMESNEKANEIWSELKKITNLPLRAIIYTHSHPDHVFGAAFFARHSRPDIYAHETTDLNIRRFLSDTSPIIGSRSMRMFGIFLDEKELINVGIGPSLSLGPNSTLGYMPPTKTFRDRLKTTIAGISIELIHAPGETDDHIYVWLPDKKILMCGDNIYKSFPNLYTIRGTWFRSLRQWYQSVDIIRYLRPEYLVPSHGRPIVGEETIFRIATDYRDAIQYVHDQSLRGINQGMTSDELASYVKLPAHLARSPYLQEFYGKVSWSARAMFAGNLGWFSGDAADLHPLSPAEQAQLMAEIAGGESRLQNQARQYLEKGNYQAALQLSGHLLRLDAQNKKAREIRISALEALAHREFNANARNYYLTEAKEIREKFVAKPVAKLNRELIERLPLSVFFDSLALNLDVVKSANLDKKVGIKFTDTKEDYTISVRRGVAEISPYIKDNLDMLVYADSIRWKEMLARLKSPVTVLPLFKYPKGNAVEFAAFMRNFHAPPMKLPAENKK